MDSFKIHGQVIADYREYIESFINIRDEEIRDVVEKALSEGRLWPEPLIQLNPSYEITGDLPAVVTSEKLHPLLKDIFKGYRLCRHQVEALRLGAAGSDSWSPPARDPGNPSLTYAAKTLVEPANGGWPVLLESSLKDCRKNMDRLGYELEKIK